MSTNDYNLPHQDLTDLVPQNMRNPMLTSLIDNLFNRFLTKDEAIPLYGYVGRKPASVDDRTPKVPQPNVERDINALIPVLSFKTGTETHSFTIQDIIRKAEVLGVSKDQSSWLYSQGNNYSPPIDLDRFTNFFNYYWVANALPNKPVLEWNPSLSPEYYAISKPLQTDADKLNVVATSTTQILLTGTGFYAQTWVVSFSSSKDFTVTASGPGILSNEQVQTYSLDSAVSRSGSTNTFRFNVTSPITTTLLTFDVVRDPIYDGDGVWIGNESFSNGDLFTIEAPFVSSTYSVTPNVGPGIKGKITAVNSLDLYQVLDGVTLKEDDRVLIKSQGTADENGIYIVKPGEFIRATDVQLGTHAIVFDKNRELIYSTAVGLVWETTGETLSNTSDWQESNYWYHRDELSAISADPTKIIQAVRPIIEYNANLVLNTMFKKGVPSSSGGTFYKQAKTEFNQAPLFDLYLYDGTHASKASSIFYYSEDPTASIDVALQRRVKHASNVSADFLFEHGLMENNSLLFFKTSDGLLHTIWHAGYSSATITDQLFAGTGNGSLTASITDPYTAQQIWTLTAETANTFSIVGSKIKKLTNEKSIVTVDTPYNNGLLNITISSGDISFLPGDVFTFSVGNFETTRYVYRDESDNIYDLFGGADSDTGNVGSWQVPRMFYSNVAADNGAEIPEGTLYSHFRGILSNQLQGVPENRAFGGSIKLWSEQQNLLASLLMQRDLTPISIIDLAQRQYESATSSMVDLFFKELLPYIASNTPIPLVTEFTKHLVNIRLKDNDTRTVLYDSTSPMPGYPATLPQLGISPLVMPGIIFDNELGVSLMQNHDGHLSPLYFFTQSFRDRLLSPGMLIERADGTFTPAVGSFTENEPTAPHKGELWFRPFIGGNDLLTFNVISDLSVSPVANAIGDYWYDRSTDVLSEWDGALWQTQPSKSVAWKEIYPAKLLNDVLINVENILFTGINSMARVYFSNSDIKSARSSVLKIQLKRELATWAAENGYDPTAPDYVSSDAFTWNYSSLGFPARWFNALTSHQLSIPGVLSTARPNLEPWRLMGFETQPSTWNSNYASNITLAEVEDPANGYRVGQFARVVLQSTNALNTTLSGLPLIDSIQLTNGQTILLVSESARANNGLWVVSSGAWSRSSESLTRKLVVLIIEGALFSGTTWVLTSDVPVVNSDEVNFEQARLWKSIMWSDIAQAVPTLKLSVDVNRDMLLPPYVSPSLPYSAYALTTVMPLTPAKSYVFGEGSPVETIWTKSIEYRYSMSRALFRQDPLAFLGHCWGFEWVEVDGIMYDGFDMSIPGHNRFRLHGDIIQPVARSVPFTLDTISGPIDIDISIVHDGYTSDRKQSFSIKTSTGVIIGYMNEGELSTVSGAGYTLGNAFIEDQGRPFRVGDTFKITSTLNGSGMTVIFEQSSYNKILGFGQTFTQALRAGSIDTTQGYSIQAFNAWNVNLGYRAGGLVSTDDLRVFNDVEALPESSYALRFKRSSYAKDLWLQGLRVSVVQMGGAISAANGMVPSTDASDWVFRVEGYNPRYLSIDFYAYQPAGDKVSFNALNKAHTDLAWFQPTDILGTPVKTQLPLTITGLQNVVDFLFGYSKLREAEGWRFNDSGIQNIDSETGRVRNWQLEIEKLIDRVYAGIELGQGHVINPFMDRIWLDQNTGLLSKFFDTSLFDITGHPAVFDTLGARINTHDLTVLRARGKSQIGANVPMFSVHAQIDEYEHLFVFNNLSSPSTGEGLIYDPFSGARIVTIKLNGRRQAAQTLRPEFGGHYLFGDKVKRNLQSSADKIANYYDTDHVFEDELSTRHALALLGFSPKQYMANLDLTERTQFNFWRGLIQMKGTNSSIDAFLNNDRFQDAKLDEYWAYKVAEYGDSRSKVFPELKLSVNDTLQQFTKLQFSTSDSNIPKLPTFTQISSSDETRWFSIDDLNGETNFEARVLGNFKKLVSVGDLITLPFFADKLHAVRGKFEKVNSVTIKIIEVDDEIILNTNFEILGYGPSTPKFNPIKLFNYVSVELIEEIPQWHPVIGQHTPSALENINIISNIDPAKYNVSTQVFGNANYDPLHMWGSKELGRVWWDTTNLEYTPYADETIYPSIDEQLSRWGTLSDYATVDVIEWVESSVPPSEYNAQSAIDAGNADLDPYTRADGQVYGANTYSRDRVWGIRPIAWSKAGVAVQEAHPSFNSSFMSILYIAGSSTSQSVYLEQGTFTEYGISPGMRLGAWQQNNTAIRPLSEYIINGFTKIVLTGSGSALPSLHEEITTSGNFSSFVNVVSSTYATVSGNLLFTAIPVQDTPVLDSNGAIVTHDWTSYLSVIELGSGRTDIALVRTDRGVTINDSMFTAVIGQVFEVTVPLFGLTIMVKSNVSGAFPTLALVNSIANSLTARVIVHDAANVQVVAPLADPDSLVLNPNVLSNDVLDAAYAKNNGVGWRAWSVPTQSELNADSTSPNNTWRAYVGEFISPPAFSIKLIQDAATQPSLMLNDGVFVHRYKSTWSAWSELKNETMRSVSVIPENVIFAVQQGVTLDRISVYVNGIAQLNSTYVLNGTVLTVLNVIKGVLVVVIVRAYTPSSTELAFNPDVLDNPLVQLQYKIDYQYVQMPTRDSNGQITTIKYYFWVKDRSTAARKKKLSVKATVDLLVIGPSNYLTFQNIIGSGTVQDQYRYDAITISGLSYVVTKDDTFKLRFTRDFTLRDDPNELDLKDTHVEWALIRPGQRTKIPESLWVKLVNTASGQDPAGNALPSQRRASYDDRNGTRTQFGFGPDQVLAPSDLVRSTLLFTILNTKLVDDSGIIPIPDYMTFLDFNQSESFFSTTTAARSVLTRIWNEAKVAQVNELFFAVLNDICAANYEMTDLFKTSRLSAYSIKVVRAAPIAPTYE
jgi:hypothetical protein